MPRPRGWGGLGTRLKAIGDFTVASLSIHSSDTPRDANPIS